MKASSESGLCATVISRTLLAELGFIEVMTPGCSLVIGLQTATQLKSGSVGRCPFRQLRNQERIQTEKRSALPTVRHYRQPTETAGEQYHLGNRASHHVAHKSERPALHEIGRAHV